MHVSFSAFFSKCSSSRVFADFDLIYSAGAKTGDWLAQLRDNGFAVIKNAIPQDRAIAYQQKAREWLKSFGNDELDYEDPETWLAKNLPIQSTINTFSAYSVAHEKFMWDARMEAGVI